MSDFRTEIYDSLEKAAIERGYEPRQVSKFVLDLQRNKEFFRLDADALRVKVTELEGRGWPMEKTTYEQILKLAEMDGKPSYRHVYDYVSNMRADLKLLTTKLDRQSSRMRALEDQVTKEKVKITAYDNLDKLAVASGLPAGSVGTYVWALGNKVDLRQATIDRLNKQIAESDVTKVKEELAALHRVLAAKLKELCHEQDMRRALVDLINKIERTIREGKNA